jgi:CelD/BcsL family acetyltransferase involved in cellulose biosynthesis
MRSLRPADNGADEGSAGLTAASEAFETVAGEWAALHSASASRTPFNHPAWHEVWLRHYGSDISPVFLAVRFGGELVSVVPLDAGPEGVRLLGGPDVCDYGTPLVAPGFERQCAEAIVEWLDADLANSGVFWGLPEAGAFTAALRAVGPENGWAAGETAEAMCPALDLPPGWEAYLEGLGKHDRHELRRKLRKLEAAGEVTYRPWSEPDEIRGRMDQLFAMMRTSRPAKAEFLTAERETFLRDVAATFSELALLRLGVLSVNNAEVAMVLTFEDAATTWLYKSGYDPAYGELSVGLLSKALAVRAAIEQGAQAFDFLRGDEAYKRALGGQPRRVVTVTLRR